MAGLREFNTATTLYIAIGADWVTILNCVLKPGLPTQYARPLTIKPWDPRSLILGFWIYQILQNKITHYESAKSVRTISLVAYDTGLPQFLNMKIRYFFKTFSRQKLGFFKTTSINDKWKITVISGLFSSPCTWCMFHVQFGLLAWPNAPPPSGAPLCTLYSEKILAEKLVMIFTTTNNFLFFYWNIFRLAS